MTRRTIVLLALTATSGSLLLMNACSSNEPGGDAGLDATTDGTSDVVANDVANDTGSDGGGTDASDAGNKCVGSDAGCHACCITSYGPDAATFFRSTLRSCACTTPGDCSGNGACGNTLCNGTPPNANCNACLFDPDAGGCFGATITACSNNTDCAPITACISQCGDGG